MTHALSTVVTIADGQADNQWQTSNDADAAVANALADILAVDFSGGNVTLTNNQFSSAMTFQPSGLSTTRNLTVPALKRALFYVDNIDTADTINVVRGSTSIPVAAGQRGSFTTDGTTNGLTGTVLTSGAAGVPTSRQVISGAGLINGGDLSADRTLAVGAGTGITVNADDVQIATAYQAVGKQTIWVPAAAMVSATTSGPASAQFETSTNDINFMVLDFDASADEHAHFNIAFPKGWNEGTVTFQVFWTTTATDTDGVAWALEGVAISDNEASDASWGTAVVVTDDAQSAAGEILVTAESSAVTIAGTPAEGDICFFRIFRDVSDANDDMTEDARLIGVKFFYTTNAANDA